jgi:uncharacterized protein YkwD
MGVLSAGTLALVAPSLELWEPDGEVALTAATQGDSSAIPTDRAPAITASTTGASKDDPTTAPHIEVTRNSPSPAPPDATAQPDAPRTVSEMCGRGAVATARPASPRDLLTAANTERARLGIAPLAWRVELADDAQAWSAHMAADQDLSHGRQPSPGAQNIAMTSHDAQATSLAVAHRNWMASPGHCRNIMNPAWTRFGAGSSPADDGNGWYSTQNFE